LTGHIERVTPYEKIPPTLLIKRGDKPEPDDFRGEQTLFFVVKGKGLVVLSGCGHRGIVNTVKQAQKLAGTDKIHAVLGGSGTVSVRARDQGVDLALEQGSRRRTGRQGPELEMLPDPADGGGCVDEGDDLPPSAALGADQGGDLVDPLNEARP
jgi:hypothetical protein